jgi:hypothetical protein
MFFYPNDDQMRNYFRGPHKHHSCKFSSNVLSCFIKEDKNTTDKGKDDQGHNVMAIAHMMSLKNIRNI